MVSAKAPEFVRNVLAKIIANEGDDLPVSAMPVDGTFPTATAQWEKRNIALEIPVWDEKICIQCGKCALVCPHAAIRIKVYDPKLLDKAPATFKSMDYKGEEFKGMKYTVQVAPEDCTGCAECVFICPAKDKANIKHKALDMVDQIPLREPERENYDFFLALPEVDRTAVKIDTVKGSQFLQPLFEYSGACAGLRRDALHQAPHPALRRPGRHRQRHGLLLHLRRQPPHHALRRRPDGRGPAWSNSLFEDNAEFGYGFRLTVDKHTRVRPRTAEEDGGPHRERAGGRAPQRAARATSWASHASAREWLRSSRSSPPRRTQDAKNLLSVADALVKKSVWIVGGDGWAYDIGYGGLDHVLASGRNVNVLVLDTEVYSNTGGQCSKATPTGAVAKFAAGGKVAAQEGPRPPRRDLREHLRGARGHGRQRQPDGEGLPRGRGLRRALPHHRLQPLHRPRLQHDRGHAAPEGGGGVRRLAALPLTTPTWPSTGKNPLKLDSKAPKLTFAEYAMKETRFKMLTKSHPAESKHLMEAAQKENLQRWRVYEQLAATNYGDGQDGQDK